MNTTASYYLWLQPNKPCQHVIPAGAVALCFSLSFSSTVVVVKLLEDRDDAASLYGRIAIGVLVARTSPLSPT